MSYENMIDGFLRETGMAATTLATLSRINRTKISQCLRGQDHFSAEESILVSDLIRDLRGILSDLQPVPVDWADCAAIQTLLEHKRQQIEWKVVAIPIDGNEVGERRKSTTSENNSNAVDNQQLKHDRSKERGKAGIDVIKQREQNHAIRNLRVVES